MGCDVAPTGPCTLTPDGEPCHRIPPEYPGIPGIDMTLIQGRNDGFTITWNVDVPDPDVKVTAYCREKVLGVRPDVSPARVLWNNGDITILRLPANTLYTVWVRRELPAGYSPWTRYEALTDSAWNTNAEIVYYQGEEVYHGADIVLIS